MAVQVPPKFSGKAPADKVINITDFKSGVNSFLDDARLPKNALRSAVNIMLDQDGIPKLRWGTKNIGDPLYGIIDGDYKFSKFEKSTRTLSEYNIAISDGRVYTARDCKGWSPSLGATLTPNNDASMLQLEDKVFIANGHDTLAYYDINTNETKSFIKLDTPEAPALERSTDLTDGDFTYYYKISAVNDVGETKAGPSGSISVNVKRDSWQNTTGEVSKEQYVKLSWPAISGAVRYNIYCSDVSGQECYIDSIAASSYTDEARSVPNMAIIAPLDDTTGGPVMSEISYSDNRLWGTGDPDNPYRVYWGGVAQNTTAFSPFYGGGWIDIAKGSGEIPVTVRSYRDGKGDPVNTVFMTSANGKGSQQQIALSSMTVGTITFIVPMVARVIGSLGTAAPDGVVEAKNNLFYPSTQSFNTTGAKADMLNVLSTDEVSLAIRPDVRQISNQSARRISAIYYEGKILWAVPYGSRTNNEVWILDLELKTWIRPWKLSVKKFISYTGSSGKERLLFRSSEESSGPSYLIEMSENYNTDNGLAFPFNLSTGLLSFDESHMSFWNVKKLYVELLRAIGNLDIVVSGTTKNRSFQSLKVFSLSGVRTFSGYYDDLYNSAMYDDAQSTPIIYSLASIKKVIKIRKALNNVKIELSGTSQAQFALSVLSIVGSPKKVSDPSSWKRK